MSKETVSKIRNQILIFIVLMVILYLFYWTIMTLLSKRFEVRWDDYSWMFQIDSITEDDEDLVISGWAFQLDQNAEHEKYEIILRDTITGKGYYPKTEYHSRTDVNEYFVCEYDYSESGFLSKISLKKLDLKNSVYEVLLRPGTDKEVYATGVYYSKGEMHHVNPEKFIPLQCEGTDLEKVVEEGILEVYRPDVGMYVYQYEGEMYWIASEQYGFVNGDSVVQFQMYTTQVDRLPAERLESGNLWSNIGFKFSANELVEWDTGQYRVAKCALPTDYSITVIWTGNYIDDWIWRSDFRPWYDFEGM